MRVAVIGGGISGLAAAHELSGTHEVRVFEASPRAGGKIESVRQDGFLMEGGPDSLVAAKPEAIELCQQLGVSLQPTVSRPVLGLYGGRLRELPEGLVLGVPSRLAPLAFTSLLSWRGKLRALGDLLVPRSTSSDESMASFVSRRLGREVLERLVTPIVRGFTGTDPERTSLAACFPQLRELERRHGSLLRGLWKTRRKGPAGPAMLAPQEGMGALVEALTRKLNVECAQSVLALERSSTGYTLVTSGGQRFEAEQVVVAVPARAAAELLAPLAPEAARELEGFVSASAATVSLGFDRAQLPGSVEASGFVVAYPGGSLIACSFVSTKLPGRSPRDQVLLRAFLRARPGLDVGQLDSEQLVRLALGELRPLLNIQGEPRVAVARLHKASMPVYQVGHLDRVRRLAVQLEPFPGLEVIGCAYTGPGLSECVRSGREAGKRLCRGS